MCMYYNILTSQKATQPHGEEGRAQWLACVRPRVWCVTAPGARHAATRLYVYMFYEAALIVEIFSFTSLSSLI